MFAGAFLAAVPAGRAEALIAAVEDATRPQLFDGERWVADYVRLRFVAVRAASAGGAVA